MFSYSPASQCLLSLALIGLVLINYQLLVAADDSTRTVVQDAAKPHIILILADDMVSVLHFIYKEYPTGKR